MTNLDDMPREAPDPETGDEKEVYAFYGLASYTAQATERGLMELALFLRLRKIHGANQATYDQVYDAIERRTFGQLLNELSEDEALEDDLRSLVDRARDVRNHLIHHFFWHYAEDFFSEEGCLRMISKLRHATALFSEMDDEVQRVVEIFGEEIGVRADLVEEMFAKLLADARAKYNSAEQGDADGQPPRGCR